MDQQRALQRYEETWLAFTEELKTNPTVTLRAVSYTHLTLPTIA